MAEKGEKEGGERDESKGQGNILENRAGKDQKEAEK